MRRRGWLAVPLAVWLGACAPRQPSPVDHAPAPHVASVDSTSVDAAVDVLRDYYEAIAARDYVRAYRHWGNDGAASRQTYDQFVAGFSNTARVQASVGIAGPMEGAAGSRYVEVPVTVHAATRDGVKETFTGHYVLRRVVVDGATAAQRRWHIDSARIRRVAS